MRHYKARSKDKFGCEFEYEVYISDYGFDTEERKYYAFDFCCDSLAELKEKINNL